jgi:hypothetical protein
LTFLEFCSIKEKIEFIKKIKNLITGNAKLQNTFHRLNCGASSKKYMIEF